MKQGLFLMIGFLLTSTVWGQKPSTFLLDGSLLQRHKKQIHTAALQAATQELIKQADEALTHQPYTVTAKTKVPPSGDTHDYMSVGPYWWPDPSKPDGLPYIRKDGQTNPERYTIKDATYLNGLCSDVQVLAVAYYFTEKEAYAQKAADLIRVWFLNPETRMNPNLNYGQAIPGITNGRGIGLIDSRYFVKLVDAVQLIRKSTHWSKQDHTALQGWFRQFMNWMLESPVGKDEEDEHNNHGTYYDFQTIGFALFLDDTKLARQMIEQKTKKRIQTQLNEDGSQPHELARTVSWGYCVMNLQGFFGIAQLAENAGVDLWNYSTPDGKGLKKAYDWLKPYAEGKKAWTHQQIKDLHTEDFKPLQVVAAAHYPEEQAPVLEKKSPLFVLTHSLF